jgi:hypothetical protein
MFEIDNVRHAIECGAAFELVDSVSDAYFDAIDLATRPSLTLESAGHYQRCRQFIDTKQGYILPLLDREQAILELVGEKRNLKEAYLDMLAQADEIVSAA